jgi:hypothetical protein
MRSHHHEIRLPGIGFLDHSPRRGVGTGVGLYLPTRKHRQHSITRLHGQGTRLFHCLRGPGMGTLDDCWGLLGSAWRLV